MPRSSRHYRDERVLGSGALIPPNLGPEDGNPLGELFGAGSGVGSEESAFQNPAGCTMSRFWDVGNQNPPPPSAPPRPVNHVAQKFPPLPSFHSPKTSPRIAGNYPRPAHNGIVMETDRSQIPRPAISAPLASSKSSPHKLLQRSSIESDF